MSIIMAIMEEPLQLDVNPWGGRLSGLLATPSAANHLYQEADSHCLEIMIVIVDYASVKYQHP